MAAVNEVQLRRHSRTVQPPQAGGEHLLAECGARLKAPRATANQTLWLGVAVKVVFAVMRLRQGGMCEFFL